MKRVSAQSSACWLYFLQVLQLWNDQSVLCKSQGSRFAAFALLNKFNSPNGLQNL